MNPDSILETILADDPSPESRRRLTDYVNDLDDHDLIGLCADAAGIIFDKGAETGLPEDPPLIGISWELAWRYLEEKVVERHTAIRMGVFGAETVEYLLNEYLPRYYSTPPTIN